MQSNTVLFRERASRIGNWRITDVIGLFLDSLTIFKGITRSIGRREGPPNRSQTLCERFIWDIESKKTVLYHVNLRRV